MKKPKVIISGTNKPTKEVTENAESISISFGDKETSDLVVDPAFFYSWGDNAVTINITRDGKVLSQRCYHKMFRQKIRRQLTYEIVAEYPS